MNLNPQKVSEHEVVLLSGESNWPFRVKILGIERLQLLFDELKDHIATDNGKLIEVGMKKEKKNKVTNVTLPSNFKSLDRNIHIYIYIYM